MASHTSGKGKVGRRDNSNAHNKENSYRNLLKACKGACPKSMTDREIMNYLKANNATEENLDILIQEMHVERKHESEWEHVTKKDQKSKKMSCFTKLDHLRSIQGP